jgi:hypothetical protein
VAREQTRGPRIDQPLERGLTLRPSVDPERVGRVSERIARFLGSWRFIGYMTGFIVFWIVLNTGPWPHPDPFPFIFLTLLLSLQASYAAPLILLAQNRQADRDRVQYQDDRARTDRLIARSRRCASPWARSRRATTCAASCATCSTTSRTSRTAGRSPRRARPSPTTPSPSRPDLLPNCSSRQIHLSWALNVARILPMPAR